MMRKPKTPPVHDNHERWLLTYADLITLLLAFFVVMYSMSRIDAKKFGAMSNALTGVLRGQSAALDQVQPDDLLGGGPLKTGALRLVQKQLQQMVHKERMEASISSDLSERGLVIHVREGALFDEGKAELTPGAITILRTIGGEISKVRNDVRVEGHTDPRPINTPRFPSNWELSTARATSVLRFLVDSTGFAPTRISAVGYGHYRPVAPNDTPDSMAKNRRVDIVILSEQMSLYEPRGVTPEAPRLTAASTGN
ncbi:MAG: flagellar motor protein MotB [Candidatus Zixiibacteriota bacterium]